MLNTYIMKERVIPYHLGEINTREWNGISNSVLPFALPLKDHEQGWVDFN
jgi:hypothetical protein